MEYRKGLCKETLQGSNSSKARGHEIEQRRDWCLEIVIKECSSDWQILAIGGPATFHLGRRNLLDTWVKL